MFKMLRKILICFYIFLLYISQNLIYINAFENISNEIQGNFEIEETIYSNFLVINKYDTDYTYMFDLNVLDRNVDELTTFITPNEFTLLLPKYIWELGELRILENHNNQDDEIETILSSYYTLSFEVNKLLNLELVRIEKLIMDEATTSDTTDLNWVGYLIIVVCILVLFGISFHFLKKKIESI